MKKIFGILITSGLLLGGCGKPTEEAPVVENITIDVTLKAGQEYTYNVVHPDDQDADDIAHISQNTQHEAFTSLTANQSQTASTFIYDPKDGFLGTDKVVITAGDLEHQTGGGCMGNPDKNPGHHGGGHHGEHEDTIINWIFNFTVVR